MRRSRATSWVRGPFGATLVSMAACEAVQPVRWDPIDVERLAADVESPTSALAPGVEDIDALPQRELLAWFFVIDAASYFRGVGDLADFELPPDTVPDLDGTQVYIRFGCPGPSQDHLDPEFRYGDVRLFSEMLSSETLSSFGAQGNLYQDYRACDFASIVVDGHIRLFVDDPAELVALAPAVDLFFPGAPDLSVDLPTLDLEDVRRTLYTRSDGSTLVLERLADTMKTVFTVRGADGSVECDLVDNPPCDPSESR